MIVIDNFIKDKKYLKELNNKKSEFFKDVYDSENYHHDVNWWKGWWEEKYRNVNEQLIEYIMKDNNPFRNDNIFKNKNILLFIKSEPKKINNDKL